MSLHSMSAGNQKLREIVTLALLAALMFATQVALAALPNIHLVAVIVILAAILFGWKALYSVYVFVLLEGLIYGFSMWFVNYLYVWTVLTVIAVLFRNNRSRWFWAAVAGIFGLLFGALCAPVDVFIGGFGYAAAKWVSGIPFDLLHCAGNFAMALVLWKPLHQLLQKLNNRMKH